VNTSPERWRRIEELFQAALDRDVRERRAFLEASCAGDEELRREVESLLEREPGMDKFLNSRARAVMLHNMAGESPASMIGRRLGAYHIVGHLGAGGMGDVYRARDTKLGRDVAIKVLPTIFAADPERLARFEREARALAALNHPHIAALYGVEESEGVRALVLELVEGPTLAERLASGPLPIKEALVIARQVAEALQAAHERGIIHRDLKPANIKLSRDGAVKVLDFGLAKAIVGDARGPDLSQSSSVTTGVTREGVLLGTIGYMSPEQATGRPTDRRTDIWAFGCVLFEMLTGRRAFEGHDVADTLAAVFVREPEWQALPDVPVAIRRLLQRCLERDLHQRIADVAAVRFVLEEMSDLAGTSNALNPTATAANASPRAMWWRIVAVSAITLLVATVVIPSLMRLSARPATPTAVTRTTIAATGPLALFIDRTDPNVALSPDGTRAVYIGNNRTQLFVRALDALDPVPIVTGTFVRAPFISPDGQWVGFFEGAALKKVRITGGLPVALSDIDATGPRGATWVTDDTIIVATDSAVTGLLRVPAGGGPAEEISRPDRARGEAQYLWPERLPGGRAVLFTITAQTGGLDAAQVAVLNLRTRTRTILLRGGSHAQYVASGHLVYVAGGALRAVPFDVGRLDVRGAGALAVPRLLTTSSGGGNFSVADDGSLLYVDAPDGSALGGRRTLVWVDRMGKEEPIAAPPRAYTYPRLSPDGTRLALDIRDQENDIWIWDFRRPRLTRLTIDPSVDREPEWTRDGQRIIFTSNRGGADNLWWQAADGSGVAEPLITSSNIQFASGATRDGKAMIFSERAPGKGWQLMQLALDGSRRVTPLRQTSLFERNGIVSPDGRWIAYESASSDSGQYEIHLRPFPNTDAGHWQVTTGGGAKPLWASNGQELFYMTPAPAVALMSVPVEASGTTPVFGTPVKVFEGYFAENPDRTYDVSADGRRFVMIKPPASNETLPPSLILVQHWAEELRRLVPIR
jgi:eukaryotic-like serine/threonine-protein kinase